MKINKQTYELSAIYEQMVLGDIMESLDDLIDVRIQLLIALDTLRSDSTDMVDRLDEIISLEEQLSYLNENIRVFVLAITCHESKVFEMRSLGNEIITLCLN
jgi:hypothetical protein